MPIYVCYRGDCDNLAYEQEGPTPFVAVDALGRQWLCVETTLTVMPSEFPPGITKEMIDAQGKAHWQGLSREGTSISWYDCPDEESLRRRLVLDSYPPFGESLDRLASAGWTITEDWEPGKPHKLTINTGIQILTAEGETENEV
jgi:hypothetical protein